MNAMLQHQPHNAHGQKAAQDIGQRAHGGPNGRRGRDQGGKIGGIGPAKGRGEQLHSHQKPAEQHRVQAGLFHQRDHARNAKAAGENGVLGKNRQNGIQQKEAHIMKNGAHTVRFASIFTYFL